MNPAIVLVGVGAAALLGMRGRNAPGAPDELIDGIPKSLLLRYGHAYKAILGLRSAAQVFEVARLAYVDAQAHSINAFASQVIGLFVGAVTLQPQTALNSVAKSRALLEKINGVDDAGLKAAGIQAARYYADAVTEATAAGVNTKGEAEALLTELAARFPSIDVVWRNYVAKLEGKPPWIPGVSDVPKSQRSDSDSATNVYEGFRADEFGY